jgi:hypothetical protein
MERPLEIAFHNLDPSPGIEAESRHVTLSVHGQDLAVSRQPQKPNQRRPTRTSIP